MKEESNLDSCERAQSLVAWQWKRHQEKLLPALSITYYLNKRGMMMTPLRFLCFVWAVRKHNNNNYNNPSVQESFGHQVTSYKLSLMPYLTHSFLSTSQWSEERGNYHIWAYLSSTQQFWCWFISNDLRVHQFKVFRINSGVKWATKSTLPVAYYSTSALIKQFRIKTIF